jgi:predicted RNA-binding protein with PIN domain
MSASKDLLVVDGYNILASWKFSDNNYNLEAARFDLEEILANYSGYKAMDIVLVFDAHSADTHGSSEKKHKLKIIYTKRGETADTKIESMMKRMLRKYRYVYVATADYALQLFVLGEGGLRMTPTELKVMIEGKTKRTL